MKRMCVKIVSLLTVLAAAMSASGCYLLPDEEEVLAPPVVKASEVKYSTVTVSRKDLVKKLTCSGTVTAEKQYMLTYEKQGGTISKFYVRAGDEVKEGDPICELETTDVDYQITEKELYKRRAELGVAIVRQNGGSQAEIDRAGVEVELIDNELEKLYERKEQAVLTSPIDGIVSAISDVRVGDSVGTGQNIATVIDTSGLYIAAKPSDMRPYTMGTELILIDGAIDRKSIASPETSDAVILSSGAVLSRNMQKVVAETAHVVGLYNLPELEECEARDLIQEARKEKERVMMVDRDGSLRVLDLATGLGASTRIDEAITEETEFVYVPGAFTSSVISGIQKPKLKQVRFVLKDPTRIFFGAAEWKQWGKRGLAVSVLKNIVIAAVTVNPYSPSGYSFEHKALRDTMQEALPDIPVIDVRL